MEEEGSTLPKEQETPDTVCGSLAEHQQLVKALMQQREDFLALLNHRLRTPLLAAHRIVRLLLDGQFGDLTKKQDEVVSLLSDNLYEINRLIVMIMDIYRYRTESKQLDLCELEIGQLISSMFASRSVGRVPVEIDIACPETQICCDESEITNLLSHLIDNALKYARSKIKVRVNGNDAQECTITVEDDGKGIAPEDIEGLFDRFYVISSTGQYAPVTGAGLCLCAEIAKAHGGHIECKSTVGEGTKFQVHLPISKH